MNLSSINLLSHLFPDHVSSKMDFSKALNRLGESAIMRDDEPDDIGAAFQKFAVVTKELSALMQGLVSFYYIDIIDWYILREKKIVRT